MSLKNQSLHQSGPSAATPLNTSSSRTHPSPLHTDLTPFNSDKNGVTIEPVQPMVGENITVTVKGQILKRVTAGKIDVDLRLMKFIKLTPQFDLCDQLDGDL